MPELTSNQAIERAAIEWVMTLERNAGRVPRDTRYGGTPADIESPPRVIEVKAFGRASIRGDSLALEKRQVDEGLRNPNFYIYVVENVRQGDPLHFTLKVLHGLRLHEMRARAKPWGTMDVPFPVAVYDAAATSTETE
jgi:hypothetical protein